MIRISSTVDEQLSHDQAEFRPGRSCCSQVQSFSQFIEDGFENKLKITATYDTVNHRVLLFSVAKVVKNSTVDSTLNKRRLYVEKNTKQSQWR